MDCGQPKGWLDLLANRYRGRISRDKGPMATTLALERVAKPSLLTLLVLGYSIAQQKVDET